MKSKSKQRSETTKATKEEWRAARRDAAKLIDPDVAEGECEMVSGDLPAGVANEMLEHARCKVAPTQEQVDRLKRAQSVAQFLSTRKAEALIIQPNEAETERFYDQIPYGVDGARPTGVVCISRVTFGLDPESESETLVAYYNLSKATMDELHRSLDPDKGPDD